MAWALYALTQNKHVQTKLRQELSNISTDNPTMDDLNGMPYLDAVVRETLRLYPPLPAILRSAKKDDCIPLSKAFTDKKGIVCNEIRLVLIHFSWCFVFKLRPFLWVSMIQDQKGSMDSNTYCPHQPRQIDMGGRFC